MRGCSAATRGTDKTPGGKGKGGYVITPDQFDRNRQRSENIEKKRRLRRVNPRPYNIYGVAGRDQNA